MPLSPFRRAAAELVGKALGVDPVLFSVSTPPDAALGDYAVGCFPAAKALKAAPPVLAKRVVDGFRPEGGIVAVQAAGPYVNVRLDRAALYRDLFARAASADLLPKEPGAGKTVCIDFSSPNIAKELAYHHIRSTVIGHALVNL